LKHNLKEFSTRSVRISFKIEDRCCFWTWVDDIWVRKAWRKKWMGDCREIEDAWEWRIEVNGVEWSVQVCSSTKSSNQFMIHSNTPQKIFLSSFFTLPPCSLFEDVIKACKLSVDSRINLRNLLMWACHRKLTFLRLNFNFSPYPSENSVYKIIIEDSTTIL
jgi:hypothetical protein